MALLNPPELLPEVARFIVRYLATRPKCSAAQDEVIATLAPASLLNPTNPDADPGSPEVEKTLGLCASLGLVEVDDGKVTLGSQLQGQVRKRAIGDDQFVAALRAAVLDEDQNQAEWGSQEGTRDFTNAIAWYLTLDPSTCPGVWDMKGGLDVQSLQREDFGSGGFLPIVNDQRWRPFVRWSGFLGFTWSHALGASVLVPDPTEAIRPALPNVLRKGEEIRTAEFRDSLVEGLPVLDGGTYRRFVEANAKADLTPSDDQLTPALSHSLLRLEAEQRLVLVDKADTEKLRLTVGETFRTASHVRPGPALER
jgi:hypothetical protein